MSNILEAKVSLFKNVSQKVPVRSIPIINFLLLSDNKLDKKLFDIRNCEDKKKRSKMKQSLPCITTSGVFSERNSLGLISSSNLMAVDFDNCDVDYTKRKLSMSKYVSYAGLSCSGKGVFAIIPIIDHFHIKEHYDSFSEHINIQSDSSCTDICRLRFFSHDDDPYINENASVYTLKKICRTKEPSHRIYDNSRFHDLLRAIIASRVDVTNDRRDWVKIGYSIASEYGEGGRGYFHSISSFHPKYSDKETDWQYSSFLKSSKSSNIGVVFNIAKNYGILLNK